MDPTARRETWELIKKESKGKIILLTTHYMDEAEVLGDRIAVMSKGKLQTCGSSMFLKDRYGLGVLIEIEPLDKVKAQNMDELEEFLKSYLDKEDDDEDGEEVQASMKFGR
jgi:ABC-type multidrug transport system ATPase subunit